MTNSYADFFNTDISENAPETVAPVEPRVVKAPEKENINYEGNATTTNSAFGSGRSSSAFGSYGGQSHSAFGGRKALKEKDYYINLERKHADRINNIITKRLNLGEDFTDAENRALEAYGNLQRVNQAKIEEEKYRIKNSKEALVSDVNMESFSGKAVNNILRVINTTKEWARAIPKAGLEFSASALERQFDTYTPIGTNDPLGVGEEETRKNLSGRNLVRPKTRFQKQDGINADTYKLYETAEEKKHLQGVYGKRIDALEQQEKTPEVLRKLHELRLRYASTELTPEEAELYKETKVVTTGRNKPRYDSKAKNIKEILKVREILDILNLQNEKDISRVNTKYFDAMHKDTTNNSEKAMESFEKGDYLKGVAQGLKGITNILSDHKGSAVELASDTIPHMVVMVLARSIAVPLEASKYYREAEKAFKEEYKEAPNQGEASLIFLLSSAAAGADSFGAGKVFKGGSVYKSIIKSAGKLKLRLPKTFTEVVKDTGKALAVPLYEGGTEMFQKGATDIAGTLRDPKLKGSELITEGVYGAVGATVINAPSNTVGATINTGKAGKEAVIKTGKKVFGGAVAARDIVETKLQERSDKIIENGKNDPEKAIQEIIKIGIDHLKTPEERKERLTKLKDNLIQLKLVEKQKLIKKGIDPESVEVTDYSQEVRALMKRNAELTLLDETGKTTEELVETVNTSPESVKALVKEVKNGRVLPLETLNTISGSKLFQDLPTKEKKVIKKAIKYAKSMLEVKKEILVGDKKKGTKGIYTYIDEMKESHELEDVSGAEQLIKDINKWGKQHQFKIKAYMKAKKESQEQDGKTIPFKVHPKQAEDSYYVNDGTTDRLINVMGKELKLIKETQQKLIAQANTIKGFNAEASQAPVAPVDAVDAVPPEVDTDTEVSGEQSPPVDTSKATVQTLNSITDPVEKAKAVTTYAAENKNFPGFTSKVKEDMKGFTDTVYVAQEDGTLKITNESLAEAFTKYPSVTLDAESTTESIIAPTPPKNDSEYIQLDIIRDNIDKNLVAAKVKVLEKLKPLTAKLHPKVENKLKNVINQLKKLSAADKDLTERYIATLNKQIKDVYNTIIVETTATDTPEDSKNNKPIKFEDLVVDSTEKKVIEFNDIADDDPRLQEEVTGPTSIEEIQELEDQARKDKIKFNDVSPTSEDTAEDSTGTEVSTEEDKKPKGSINHFIDLLTELYRRTVESKVNDGLISLEGLMDKVPDSIFDPYKGERPEKPHDAGMLLYDVLEDIPQELITEDMKKEISKLDGFADEHEETLGVVKAVIKGLKKQLTTTSPTNTSTSTSTSTSTPASVVVEEDPNRETAAAALIRRRRAERESGTTTEAEATTSTDPQGKDEEVEPVAEGVVTDSEIVDKEIEGEIDKDLQVNGMRDEIIYPVKGVRPFANPKNPNPNYSPVGTPAGYNARDIFKAREKSKKKKSLLKLVPNFFSKYAENPNNLLTAIKKIVKDSDTINSFKDLDPKDRESLKSINTFFGVMSPKIKNNIANFLARKSEIYWETKRGKELILSTLDQSPLGYLVQMDSKNNKYINENLIGLMTTALYQYFGTVSPAIRTNSQVNALLNRDSNKKVDDVLMAPVRLLGDSEPELAERLGKFVVDQLDIETVVGAVDGNMLDRLAANIGLVMIAAGREAGFLVRQKFNINTVLNKKGEAAYFIRVATQGRTEFTDVATAATQILSKADFTPHSSVGQIKNKMQANPDFINKFFGMAKPEQYPSFKPIKSLPETLKNTLQTLPKKLQKHMLGKQSTATKLKVELYDVATTVSRDSLNRMSGVVDPSTQHVTKVLYTKAVNEDVVRDLDNYLDLVLNYMKDVRRSLYLPQYVMSTHRSSISGSKFNPINSKVHRALAKQDGSDITVPKEGDTDTPNVRRNFKRAVVQAFGGKIEQMKYAQVERTFEQILNSEEVIKGLAAYKKLKSNFETSKEIEADLEAAVAFGKKNLLTLSGLVALSKYDPENAFETDIAIQYDGVANGIAISLLQVPLDENIDELLETVGIYIDRPKNFNYSKWASNPFNVDIYKLFGRAWNSKVIQNAKDNGIEKSVELFQNLVGGFEEEITVGSATGSSALLTVITKFVRDLVKYPLMKVNYASGTGTAVEDIKLEFLDKIYDKLANASKEEAKSIIDSINTIVGANHFKAINLNNPRMIKLPEATVHGLNRFIVDNYTSLLEDVLKASFPELNRTRKVINTMISVIHKIFEKKYEMAIAAKQRSVNGRVLHPEEVQEVLESIKEYFPTVRGAASEGRDDGLLITDMKRVRQYRKKHYKVQMKDFHGTDVTMNTSEMEYAPPGVKANALMTQSTDSAVQMNSGAGYNFTDLYDAQEVSIADADAGGLQANRNLWDITGKYSPIEAVYETFRESLNLVGTNTQFEVVIKKALNPFAKEEEDQTRTLDDFTIEILTLLNEIKETQEELRALPNVLVNNYAQPDGVYIANEQKEETSTNIDEDIEVLVTETINKTTKVTEETPESDTPAQDAVTEAISKQLDGLYDLYKGVNKEAVIKKNKELKKLMVNFLNDTKAFNIKAFEDIPLDNATSKFSPDKNSITIVKEQAEDSPVVVSHELLHAGTMYGIFKLFKSKDKDIIAFSNLLEKSKEKVLEELNKREGVSPRTKSAINYIVSSTTLQRNQDPTKATEQVLRVAEAVAILAIEPRVRKEWVDILNTIDSNSSGTKLVPPIKKTLLTTISNLIKKLDSFLKEAIYTFIKMQRSVDKKLDIPPNGALDLLYKVTAKSIKENKNYKVEGKDILVTEAKSSISKIKKRDQSGSSPSDIDFNNFVSTYETSLNSTNTINVFNRLEDKGNKPENLSHQNTLKNVLMTVVNKILVPTDKIEFKLGKTDKSSFGAAQGKKVYIKASTASRLNSNSDMSMQEVHVHELLHVVLNAGLKKYFNINVALVKLHEEVKEKITEKYGKNAWKIFLHEVDGKPSYVVDKDKEEAAAKERYDYIFNNTRTHDVARLDPMTKRIHTLVENDYLAEFVAFGKTNEKFGKILAGIEVNRFKSTKGMTLGDKLNTWFDNFINLLSNSLYRVKGKTADVALDALVRDLTNKIVKDRIMVNNLDKPKFDINQVTKDALYNKIIKPMVEDEFKSNKERPTFVSQIPLLIKYIPMTQHSKFLNDYVTELRRRSKIADDGFLVGLLGEVKGGTLAARPWHTIFRYSRSLVDAVRFKIAAHTRHYARNAFKAGIPTEDESKALTRVVMKSDMVNLFETFTMDQINEILKDHRALEANINSTRQELAKFGRNQNFYINQARGLGNIQALGYKGAKVQGTNAYNIARLRSDTRPKGKEIIGDVKEAEEIIGRLVTLYALKAMPQSNKTLVSKVIEREQLKDPVENGVITLFQLLKLFKEESLQSLFAGNKTQTFGGYIHESFNPYTETTVATLKDVNALKEEGFVPVDEVLTPDPNDPNRALRQLMVKKNSVGHIYRKFTVSLTNLNSKGTSLFENLIEEHGGETNEAVSEAVAEYLTASHEDIEAQYNDPDVVLDKESSVVPIFDDKGNITDFRYLMHEKNKIAALERDDRFDHVIGNMFGSIKDKVNSAQVNKKVVEMAWQDYQNNYASDPKGYVEVSAKTGNTRYKNIYNRLPKQMKEDIKKVWGAHNPMYIRAEQADIIFGYRDLSVGNLFKNAQNPIGKSVHKFLNREMVRLLELGVQEFVKLAKTTIVVRLPVVLTGNLISNWIVLVTKGVPWADIVKNQALAVRALNKYQTDVRKRDNLELRINSDTNMSAIKRKELQATLNNVQSDLTNSPIASLIEEGMFQPIVEDVDLDKSAFSLKEKALKKTRLDKILYNKNKLISGAAQNLFMTEETELFQFMTKATQYSDFIGRFTLHEYNMNKKQVKGKNGKVRKGMEFYDSIQDVLDAFVNYDLPTRKEIQYGNNIGLLMFSKFTLRILRAIYSLAKDRPISLTAMVALQNLFIDVPDVLDTLDPGSLASKIGFENVIDSGLTVPGIDNVVDIVNAAK